MFHFASYHLIGDLEIEDLKSPCLLYWSSIALRLTHTLLKSRRPTRQQKILPKVKLARSKSSLIFRDLSFLALTSFDVFTQLSKPSGRIQNILIHLRDGFIDRFVNPIKARFLPARKYFIVDSQGRAYAAFLVFNYFVLPPGSIPRP